MSPLPSPVVTLEIETVGPAPLDPRASAAHGADARRRAARDRRLPARRARARSRRCSCACRTTRTAATAGCRSWPRTSSPAATRSCRRTCAASSAPRAIRSRSSARCRTRYDTHRVDHAAAVVERRRRHVGRQLLRLHAMGRGRGRAPGAQGDRPARHDRRHRRLARGRDPALRRRTTWPSTGPTTTRTSGRPTGARGRWPSVFDPAFEALGRRSASFDYVLERSRGGERIAAVPGRASIRACCGSRPCTASAGSTTSRRRTCWTTRRSCGIPRRRRSSTCTPARRTTRTTSFEHVPIPESDDHAQHDDALERMLAALHRAGARLLRRVPDRHEPTRPTCRASRWHLAARRLAGVARAGRRPAPASCASTSTTPGVPRSDADGRVAGGGAGEDATRRRGSTIPSNLVPVDARRPVRGAATSTPTSARSSRAPTC